jgi:hypothetical protein
MQSTLLQKAPGGTAEVHYDNFILDLGSGKQLKFTRDNDDIVLEVGSGDIVLTGGDVRTLTVTEASTDDSVATKKYVDDKVGAVGGGGGDIELPWLYVLSKVVSVYNLGNGDFTTSPPTYEYVDFAIWRSPKTSLGSEQISITGSKYFVFPSAGMYYIEVAIQFRVVNSNGRGCRVQFMKGSTVLAMTTHAGFSVFATYPTTTLSAVVPITDAQTDNMYYVRAVAISSVAAAIEVQADYPYSMFYTRKIRNLS